MADAPPGVNPGGDHQFGSHSLLAWGHGRRDSTEEEAS